MKATEQKDSATPPTGEAATPFFARFLEDQHADAEPKPAARLRTLKYPSDRDEDDVHSHARLDAAPTDFEPQRRTLKYPSDRDEIDFYAAHDREAAAAR